MHILATTSTTLDEIAEPVDLAQPPGDILVLSFADSDLSGLSAAWSAERSELPTVRLASLRDLRHPMSVDLWVDRAAVRARVILVRLLGGLDWWRYGVERLSALARERGIALAVLPGEDRDDPRLAEASTLPQQELEALLAYFRAGGRENLRSLLRRLAGYAGVRLAAAPPCALPHCCAYLPDEGAVDLDHAISLLPPGEPVIPILLYRSTLLAADCAPIDALCGALSNRGLAPMPLVLPSLKDSVAAEFVRTALQQLRPAVVVTTTAFAAGEGGETPLDVVDAPVLQAVMATTKHPAWRDSPRGLGAADLAMHVVMPELDGRVLAGALAFKRPLAPEQDLAFTALVNAPEADRVDMVADRIAALVRLQVKPRKDRRVIMLMPDYAGAAGRTGYAVGLDVPASVVAALSDLAAAGYTVSDAPETSRALLDLLEQGDAAFPVERYQALTRTLPQDAIERMRAVWGEPADDADVRSGCFRFRAARFGNVTVALPPDRGRASERRADYHDPVLPPRHALLAFGLWLRDTLDADAVVHMGAHGTLEWLPGKAVALTASCYPEMVLGSIPVIYPFIVSNPGEAAQAKRRIAAVTIGHVPPPLAATELAGPVRDLERLVDEYAQAEGLDPRRRVRLARSIVEQARATGFAREAGLEHVDENEALRRIDAWLCDLKDLAIKDGLHIYGRASPDGDPAWETSAQAERAALLAALDGKRVRPGPAGSPARGRRDVLPTGRNLYTADPRTLPTQTAMDLGALAADELVRLQLQSHGEMPRAVVIDLWGSAVLRSGGEEMAQGLALMGCRPNWDGATGRVTGVEVLPPAALGRPRVDVTWRISGLFRDLFPAQIALLDAATRAVAAREESDDENPLAAERRAAPGATLTRIFGTAPGAYGAGIEDMFGHDNDTDAFSAAYLAAASHGYGGGEGDGRAEPESFAARVAAADLLVHASADPGRDLLEGDADVAFVGGFAAAATAAGTAPDLIILDTTDPRRPRARPLAAALARIVRARAISPRFIEGQMRHGPRGAAEFAETVDRLVAFAETTGAVPGALIDLVHDAYVADQRVRDFLARENPAAARAIAERLDYARRRGLWHPLRNSAEAELAALSASVRHSRGVEGAPTNE